jgi:hypothetical protein
MPSTAATGPNDFDNRTNWTAPPPDVTSTSTDRRGEPREVGSESVDVRLAVLDG